MGSRVLAKPSLLTLPFFALVIVATWMVRTHFFFWDTVQLASQHAQFFLDSSFSTFLLPDEMDSGHPPSFGLYLASVWFIFGKSLAISHLAMLPFLLGIVWQAWRLGENYLGTFWAAYFLMVLCANPVVASQAILVSPDVVLLFFFLMAWRYEAAVWASSAKSWQFLFFTGAILGLSLISLRGMMVVAALFGYQVWRFWQNPEWATETRKKGIVFFLLPYFVGGTAALSFFVCHYAAKGWIGYFAGSSWASAFERVDALGFLKNSGLFLWRLLDFGYGFVWATIVGLGIWQRQKLRLFFPKTRQIEQCLLVLLLVLSPTLLLYKGLLNHRYLLPIYVAALLLAIKLISDLKHRQGQIILAIVLFLGLTSGNFWVYPQPIATGWDATLAHLPYYRLRTDMLEYIDAQHIKLEDIGTAFPNLRSSRLIDLNTAQRTHLGEEGQFARLDFSKNKFVLYSNVMNDFSAEDLKTLEQSWGTVKILRGGQVVMILYRKLF